MESDWGIGDDFERGCKGNKGLCRHALQSGRREQRGLNKKKREFRRGGRAPRRGRGRREMETSELEGKNMRGEIAVPLEVG